MKAGKEYSVLSRLVEEEKTRLTEQYEKDIRELKEILSSHKYEIANSRYNNLQSISRR